MKKILVVLVILLAAGTLYANPISLGSFPVGKWLDFNYDAVWEFSSNNIRILDKNDKVLWDFSTLTIQEFRPFVIDTRPAFSFSCPETKRSYRFIISSLINMEVILEIDREGMEKYIVQMRRM